MALSTPTLLFGAISLIMLAYTNRFFLLGQLVRGLIEKDLKQAVTDPASAANRMANTHRQIAVLKRRLRLMVWTQVLGVLSFLFCTGSTLLLYFGHEPVGSLLFVVSVLALMLSLVFFLCEIIISTHALNLAMAEHEQAVAQEQTSGN